MNKKGFTFIEAIIIFTIILVMTSVVLSVSYADRIKKVIINSSQEVVAGLRETQNSALAGKQKNRSQLPCSFTFHLNQNGYGITTEVREIDEDCANGTSVTIMDGKLPENVTMQAYAEPIVSGGEWSKVTDISFDVPYGTIVINGETEKYKGVEIVLTGNEKDYFICVHSVGLIEDYGFIELEENEKHACVF